jgi:Zn finger protein HypA/HybF involved in hydrogenase expression
VHEAGIAQRALHAVEAAIPEDAAGRPPRALTLHVTDPAHVDIDAVTLHLEIAMVERGWPEIPIAVSIATVVCAQCGALVRPEGEWPFCSTCGAPLPDEEGAGIEISATW